MTELLHCPFCGNEWKVRKLFGGMFYGMCHGCHIETPLFRTMQEVISYINTRHVPEPKPVRIEELEPKDKVRITGEVYKKDASDEVTLSIHGRLCTLFQDSLNACNAELLGGGQSDD